MRPSPFTCLLASCWLWTSLPAVAQPDSLVVANLSLPASVWPGQREAVIELLGHAGVDVVLIQQVRSHDRQAPEICNLAVPLQMHCDFVSADPPSLATRQGLAMLSRRPIVEDGASLLHGEDGSAPVAAGYWRLQIGTQAINLYSASLASGQRLQQRRQRQASDLRDWMASHDPALANVVVARFGSRHAELLQLMPGLGTARKSLGPEQAHGLDVLYPPERLRLKASTVLELHGPAPPGDDPANTPAAQPAQMLGIVVELELPAAP